MRDNFVRGRLVMDSYLGLHVAASDPFSVLLSRPTVNYAVQLAPYPIQVKVTFSKFYVKKATYRGLLFQTQRLLSAVIG